MELYDVGKMRPQPLNPVASINTSASLRHYPNNPEELAYLALVRKVLEHGELRQSERTGVGTLSLFGERLEFDLRDNHIPLMSARRLPFRTILRELLWFLSGSTDAKVLQRQGVKIWDANTSRTFLDSRDLTMYREGDLGPGYGFQWRHFGAKYDGCDLPYTNLGVDQIQRAVDAIIQTPESRRIVVSAWNPSQLDETALPPCHCFFQFYVRRSREPNAKPFLDCMLYQRSCDLILGVPFNIASYSILTHMMACVTGTTAGRFIHVLGDTHIYTNHTHKVENELLKRFMSPTFPKLTIKRVPESIFDFNIDDFTLEDYTPDEPIAFEMAT